MSDVSKSGSTGTVGINGVTPGAPGTAGGPGGSATATNNANGVDFINTAEATGGAGLAGAGVALATATGSGEAGTASSTASTSLGSGFLVTAVQAAASAPVSGTTVTDAEAQIGGTTATFSTGKQSIATVDGAPALASVTTVLNANSNIAAAFATNPSYFGLGELGGAYSKAGSGTQTEISNVTLTVDLTKVTDLQNLELGLYSGKSLGSGFESLTCTVIGDGTQVLTTTFTSAGAAKAFFTNDAIELGSLTSGPLSGSTLSLSIGMSITTTAAGQGFDAGFLIGDPPAGSSGSGLHQLTAAAAGFGTQGAPEPAFRQDNDRQVADGLAAAGLHTHWT